ncbi:hypothetical protein lerEdw1_011860, partial [Lerista edwardsae]
TYVCLFLLLLYILSLFVDSSNSIPAPQNLTIESFNFKNKLRWSPVNSGSVSYTVEFSVKGPDIWEEDKNCVNIKKLECDFVPGKDFYIIIFRVRAQQGKLKSNWTETPPFYVKNDTTLGPPKNINISARADSLIISFDHPFKYTATSSPFEYFIYYWDNSTKTNAMSFSFADTSILYITLIFGFVVFILIAVFLCLMAVRKYEDAIKSLWRPPLTIPLHFEEDLQNFQIITVKFMNNPEEEHWDTLSVVSNAEES